MNDGHLFKAKRTDNGEWVEGYLMDENYINTPFNDNDACGRFDDPVEVEPSTICRHTGFLYRNQKKIWESDIVKYRESIGIVTFGKHGIEYGLYIQWIRGDVNLRKDFLYWHKEVECIGNIFDNPESLKGE